MADDPCIIDVPEIVADGAPLVVVIYLYVALHVRGPAYQLDREEFSWKGEKDRMKMEDRMREIMRESFRDVGDGGYGDDGEDEGLGGSKRGCDKSLNHSHIFFNAGTKVPIQDIEVQRLP